MMKQEYEKIVLNITVFACEDVITTSSVDRNNAYTELSQLDDTSGRTPGGRMPGGF